MRLRPRARAPVEVLAFVVVAVIFVHPCRCLDEDAVFNVTRLEGGDVFYIAGGECGVTRCTEVSAGTALSSRPPGYGPPCGCRCPRQRSVFREDLRHCVDSITECSSVDFGSGESLMRVPLVFIPLGGQIVHPSNDIKFDNASDAICAVSSAQFLTKTGWSGLRDDDDVPFGFFRDEGKVYLIWRGTDGTRAKVTGRIISVRLTCSSRTISFEPCVSFRVPGSPPDVQDVTEVWFSHGGLSADNSDSDDGENGERSNDGMGRAAGVVIVLSAIIIILLYGSLLFIHIRNKNRQFVLIDTERNAFENEVLPNTKTNPLITIETFLKEARASAYDNIKIETKPAVEKKNSIKRSRSIEHKRECHLYTPESNKSSSTNATVHSAPKKEKRPKTRSFSNSGTIVEKIPELHISIVEASEQLISEEYRATCSGMSLAPIGPQRKKLYFNPAFFELEYLKSPPPAAIEFLTKIREVIAIAKTKMLQKRFVPVLPPIPEEDRVTSFPVISLPFPYETLKKNRSVVSLKRENSRRRTRCSGCPGCTDMKFKKTYLKTLSEKEFCKECISNEFKQDIVKRWLDEVPLAPSGEVDTLKQCTKSVARMNGTPDSVKPESIKRKSQDAILIAVPGDSIKRMSVPPPPPPPFPLVNKDDEEYPPIPKDLKEKMNAVINELSSIRRIEPIAPRSSSPIAEVAVPFIPKAVMAVTPRLVIPTPPKYAKHSKPKVLSSKLNKVDKSAAFEPDSLERGSARRRASLSNIDYMGMKDVQNERHRRRRSSIIAMDELEPMKKIHEMNSRLSRSFQEMSAASLAWSDELNRLNDADRLNNNNIDFRKANLISEVYVSDAKSEKTKNLKVKYLEPILKPGQLVIEVDGPPQSLEVFDHEDFDPDTLDRKPQKLKLHKDISLSPDKNIDKLFDGKKVRVGSLLQIFEAKNKHGSVPDLLIDDYKPPLPPKKSANQKKYYDQNSNIYVNADMKFRITRSEPYSSFETIKTRFPNVDFGEKKRFTTFGSMATESKDTYHSLDANYENCLNGVELANSRVASKKAKGRSGKYRVRRVERGKPKTEDSGYLSSEDSNESRQRRFVLQIRDRNDQLREVASDTDDHDEDSDEARSESGGESVETSSVFFGVYGRVQQQQKEQEDHGEDSGFHGELPKVNHGANRPISAYKRLSTFDKL